MSCGLGYISIASGYKYKTVSCLILLKSDTSPNSVFFFGKIDRNLNFKYWKRGENSKR